MKNERNLISQVQRIDREKANRSRKVREIPKTGNDGDLIVHETESDMDILLRVDDDWVSILGTLKSEITALRQEIETLKNAK